MNTASFSTTSNISDDVNISNKPFERKLFNPNYSNNFSVKKIVGKLFHGNHFNASVRQMVGSRSRSEANLTKLSSFLKASNLPFGILWLLHSNEFARSARNPEPKKN
jgi:hypothetical protein